MINVSELIEDSDFCQVIKRGDDEFPAVVVGGGAVFK